MRKHFFGKTIRLLVLLFGIGQMISCGQKGDLYLPDDEPSSISSVTLSDSALT